MNFEVFSSSIGHLLKDWQKIAGRDVSPIRHKKTSHTQCYSSEQSTLKPCNLTNRSISPDLFASDEECESKVFREKSEEFQAQEKSLKINENCEYYDLTHSEKDDEEIKNTTKENTFLDSSKISEDILIKNEFVIEHTQLIESPNKVEVIDVICISDDEDQKLEDLNESIRLKGGEYPRIGIDFNDSHNTEYFGSDWMKFIGPDEGVQPLDYMEDKEEKTKIYNEAKNTSENQISSEEFFVTDELFEKEVVEWNSSLFTEKNKIFEEKIDRSLRKLTQSGTNHADTSLELDAVQEWDGNLTSDQEKSFEVKSNTQPCKQFEKISTSDEDSQLNQENICISDEELNYSCTFATPAKGKQKENNLSVLNDSFNDFLNQTNIQKQLEGAESTPVGNRQTNANFVIKTKNVTPMANYDEMNTPKIVKELNKFGIKPMKRQRGAKMLKYIYESTHPLVEEYSDNEEKVAKKRKTVCDQSQEVANEIDEELIFERKPMKKGPCCRIPLHIVWHNFIMSNSEIRENILLYEPLQLEVLHSMLKEQGYRFNVQDLIRFLDQKCITFRIAQGQRHGVKNT